MTDGTAMARRAVPEDLNRRLATKVKASAQNEDVATIRTNPIGALCENR